MKSKSGTRPPGLPADLFDLWDECTRGGIPAGRLALVTEAFLCLARLRAVRELLDRDGLTLKSARSKMVRANPLINVELLLRRQVAQLWEKSHLVHMPRRGL